MRSLGLISFAGIKNNSSYQNNSALPFKNRAYPTQLQALLKSLQQDFIVESLNPQQLVNSSSTVSLLYFENSEALAWSNVADILDNFSQCKRPQRLIAVLGFYPSTELNPKILSLFDDFVSVQNDYHKIQECILQQFDALANRNQECDNTQVAACQQLDFIGQSPQYLQLTKDIHQFAQCDVTVLIEGETGTGKELVAQAVHALGSRNTHSFIPINCAAIPDTLFESELFGHEKGAFTDARQRHRGLVELAESGTLFLDEVDSLSEKAQSSLLRFLQTGEYRPVGSSTIKQANVRIISATNKSLDTLVSQQKFREDLLFRLKVLSISVPALRSRIDDIDVISRHLLQKFANKHGRGQKILDADAIKWLKQQSWPGNIRELENALLRAYLLSSVGMITIQDIDRDNTITQASLNKQTFYNDDFADLSFQQAKESVMQHFASVYLSSQLARTAGNVSKAAKLAGKERRAFGKLLKKYNVDKSVFFADAS